MARLVANVDVTTETFASWLTKTNQLLDALSSEIITANQSFANTGNTAVNRHARLYGGFTANSLYVFDVLNGGANSTTGGTLTIGSNSIINGSVLNINANVVQNATSLSVQSNSVLIKSNTSITAISIQGNSTATNTTLGGTTLNISPNVSITGLLSTTANANFDSGLLFLDAVSNRVGIGNLIPDATLALTGTANVSGAVRLANTLTVIGTSAFTNASFANAVSIANTIAVTGNATFSNAVSIAGAVTLNGGVVSNANFDSGTLFVDSLNNRVGFSNTAPDATVAVTGTANVSGAVRLANTLAVVGATTLSNTITVTGNATFSNQVSITGNVTILGTVGNTAFANAVTFANTIAVTGASTFSNSITVGGLVTLNGGVSGNANFDSGTLFVDSLNNRVGFSNTTPDATVAVTGTANVSGATRLANTLAVIGAGTFSNTINVTGNATFSNQMSITGNATFSNSVTIAGSLIVSGSVIGGASGATLIANNTDTQTFYIPMANTTSGTWSNAVVSSTKMYFVPSTGILSATGFTSLSDINHKTNLTTIVNPTETIRQITGYEFDWVDGSGKSAGVIAQYIEQILPHLVNTADDGGKSVNYSGLIAYLIETIKQMDERITTLETK